MTWIDTCKIPLKDRSSYIYLEYGTIDVEDGAFILRDINGIRIQIPIASLSCLLVGPGTNMTHAAVRLAAEVSCLILWVGEHGVRLYSTGMPGGHRCDKLLTQASYALDPTKRLKVVRKMYQYRFEEKFANDLSIEQMRGKEAARVKNIYRSLAEKYGVEWNGRCYDGLKWSSGDLINRCISSATSCLYGICESAILIAGYSPAIGFIHYGRPRSFVYDVADLLKYETVVPAAFEIAASSIKNPEQVVRRRCRDYFKKERVLDRIVPLITHLFDIEELNYSGIVDPPEFSMTEGKFYDGTHY